MAVATLSYTAADVNGIVKEPTDTTVSTDGAALADALPEQTVLLVTESGGTANATLTVKAGDQPPAIAAGQGDLALTITKSTTQIVGPLDSSRFLQSDGSLSFDASASVGVIAIKVARH